MLGDLVGGRWWHGALCRCNRVPVRLLRRVRVVVHGRVLCVVYVSTARGYVLRHSTLGWHLVLRLHLRRQRGHLVLAGRRGPRRVAFLLHGVDLSEVWGAVCHGGGRHLVVGGLRSCCSHRCHCRSLTGSHGGILHVLLNIAWVVHLMLSSVGCLLELATLRRENGRCLMVRVLRMYLRGMVVRRR